MQMRYIISAILTGCVLVAGSTMAESKDQQWEKRQEHRKNWEEKVNKIYDLLELSPDQQQQLKDNRGKYQLKKDDIYNKIYQARRQLNLELQKPSLNMDRMRQLHSQIKELKLLKEDLRFESILEVRKILSSEQFQEFMKLKEEWKARFRESKENK